MKRLFLTLGMLVAMGAVIGTSAYAENLAVNKVIKVPGATREQLFQKVRTWSERYGRSYSADGKSGVIVANGEIEYPSPPIDRIQYSFLFKIKNSVRKNKVAVEKAPDEGAGLLISYSLIQVFASESLSLPNILTGQGMTNEKNFTAPMTQPTSETTATFS